MNGPSIVDLYKKYGPNRDNGYKTLYTETRRRWAQTADLELVHYVIPEEEALEFHHDEHREGWGPTHILMIANSGVGNRFFAMNLSGMTEEELDSFKEVMLASVESAREVVKHRDEKAQEAFDGSDGTIHHRSYRPAPIVVDRDGPK